MTGNRTIGVTLGHNLGQGRSQRGAWVHVPVAVGRFFVTAPLVFSRVSIFCTWTPLETSVPRRFVPLKFLATPLNWGYPIYLCPFLSSHLVAVSSPARGPGHGCKNVQKEI